MLSKTEETEVLALLAEGHRVETVARLFHTTPNAIHRSTHRDPSDEELLRARIALGRARSCLPRLVGDRLAGAGVDAVQREVEKELAAGAR
jgi:hypothetical protein